MGSEYKNLKTEISHLIDDEQAIRKLQFFQTGKGEYGEGDQFLGISVPQVRKLAKKYYKTLKLNKISNLLSSPFNEERLLGLVILIEQYGKVYQDKEIYDFFLEHMHRVNNWNLVDASAYPIVGVYLKDKDRKVLQEWARSENLWIRRIAIVATWNFIKFREFNDTLRIATILLDDNEDLIHKAVGWMLREVGKKDELVLKEFLKKHQKIMPRTMLRYAIERLNSIDRKLLMEGSY